MRYFVCFVAKSSALEMKAHFLMMGFAWGQYTGAGIQVLILPLSRLNENVFIESVTNKTLTLSVPLIQLLFFVGANLCRWLHTTSL